MIVRLSTFVSLILINVPSVTLNQSTWEDVMHAFNSCLIL